MTWKEYAEGLEARLLDLHRRVQAGAYRAPAVRRVYIPKPDGGTRPFRIAAVEDKIVQKSVVDGILTPIYEAEFLGFSYGFRPGRGSHDALDALAYGIEDLAPLDSLPGLTVAGREDRDSPGAAGEDDARASRR